jgi:hypothetical protein
LHDFLTRFLARLSSVSIEPDYLPDVTSVPESLQPTFEGALSLIERVRAGLMLFNSMQLKVDDISTALASVKEAIGQVDMMRYLRQGLRDPEVCCLVEAYMGQLDMATVVLNRERVREMRVMTAAYVPEEAMSMFLGLRYLR